MKILLLIVTCLIHASVGQKDLCSDCTYPLYSDAKAYVLTGTDVCPNVMVDSVFNCLAHCEPNSSLDVRDTFKIAQLVHVALVFGVLDKGPIACKPSECDADIVKCVAPISSYHVEPVCYTHKILKVNLKCKDRKGDLQAALECVKQAPSCGAKKRDNLLSILKLGWNAACTHKARCVRSGIVYEVKPGTNCKQYYAVANFYGSTKKSRRSLRTVRESYNGFDVATCYTQPRNSFSCPA